MKVATYSVSKINSYIKNMFAQDFLLHAVYVKGEVSNCKYHSSGHIYFTLKDSGGTLGCIMFASKRAGLGFELREGQQVIVGGSVEVYERDGKYQLYANRIFLDGLGALYEKYEALKKELLESGMFDESYKKPIPANPKTVGIVTAATGAAVRDIINVATRRNPYVQLILYPAIVQGDGAVPSIVDGIRTMVKLGVDVMIVGRGGGSIEDLWAFNERAVAEAVFESPIPVISAVGHETDTTIIDYVSDLRAPTPSAAAELAVGEFSVIENSILEYQNRLLDRMNTRLLKDRSSLNNLQARLRGLSPINILDKNKLRIAGYEEKLANLMDLRVKEVSTYSLSLEDRLAGLMEKRLVDSRHKMELLAGRLNGLSPLEKLSQGYAYVSDEDNRTVCSIDNVSENQRLNIYVKDGQINAVVCDKHRIDF